MENNIDVTVEIVRKNGEYDDVEIEIDVYEFSECETYDEKKDYVKNKVMNVCDDIKKINVNKDTISEIDSSVKEKLEEINNTYDLHPNETSEEFMEHEDF